MDVFLYLFLAFFFVLAHYNIGRPALFSAIALRFLKAGILIIGGISLVASFVVLLIGFILLVVILTVPYLLTIILPSLGRVNFQSRIANVIDWLEVSERRREIVEASNESEEEWDEMEADAELRKLRQKAKRRLEHGELVLALTLTLIFVLADLRPRLFGIFNRIAPEWQVEVLLGAITLSVLFQIVLIEVVAYSGINDVETEDYGTAIAWQRGLTENKKRLLFAPLILGFSVITKPMSEQIRTFGFDFLDEKNVSESSNLKLVIQVGWQWLNRD